MSVLRIVGLCFCAAGVIAIAVGFWMLRSGIQKAQTWPSADAEVLSSRVVVREGTDNDEVLTEYELRYAVQGATVQSHFESWSGSTAEAQSKAARHPAGSRGKLSYDPQRPSNSDPNLGMNPATLAPAVWVMAGGIGAILFGCLFAVLGGAVASGDLW